MAKQKALIVDDSDVLRRLIEMCLRPAGFEIATASSGSEALEVSASFVPDLVLLDIGLPDMTGWDVLAALRESPVNSDVKVMILSGYEDLHTQSKQRGADGAIVKPFRNDELRKAAVDLVTAPAADVTSAS
ncbi:MAG: response regulator [bacterium]|nr:response regulator [bacterium]